MVLKSLVVLVMDKSDSFESPSRKSYPDCTADWMGEKERAVWLASGKSWRKHWTSMIACPFN